MMVQAHRGFVKPARMESAAMRIRTAACHLAE
jgi:hypothetical protein